MKSSPPIYVTRAFIPPPAEYLAILEPSFARAQLTNQGPLVSELETVLQSHLGVRRLQLLANGTLALQLALKALGIEGGEIITTPFSYVATVSAILWERCTPVFADIAPESLTLAPEAIEKAVTLRTRAIMPVHVFGRACEVDAIQGIADRHGLKIIYDGAHAFGGRYRGRSLLSYGDICTCSFHATKLFHTVEGGACVAADPAAAEKLNLMKRFGHTGDDHFHLGINAKMSEPHAAMGLAGLPHLGKNIAARRRLTELYDQLLEGAVARPGPQPDLEFNYGYYPVMFKDEQQLLRVFKTLAAENVFPRRYFFPSLNLLPYLDRTAPCPVSENVASRVACLPLYPELAEDDVRRICRIVMESL